MFVQIPSYISKGDVITTHLKVIDVFKSDSLANVDMRIEYPQAVARNRATGATRLQEYIDRKEIKAELTSDTVFIETIQQGNGDMIKAGDHITIRFKAETLSGRIIGDNTGADTEPMEYEVMTGALPIGIEESLLHCRI